MKRSLFVMITVAAICCFAGCAQKAEHKTVKEEKAASTTSDTTQYKSEPKGDIDVLKKSYPDWIKNGEVNYPYTLKSQELKEAKSYNERTKLVNVPQEITESCSTAELLHLIEEYPLLDLSLYDTMDIAVENYRNVNTAFDEFFQRENGPKEALNALQQNAKNLSVIKEPEVYKRTLDGMQLELYVVLSAHGYESLGAKQAANVKQIVTQMKDAIEQDQANASTTKIDIDKLITDKRWTKELS